MFKKIVTITITAALLIIQLPSNMYAAESAQIHTASETEKKTWNQENETTLTLDELQKKFPHGKYWNHAENAGASNWLNNQDSYTSTPCQKHGVIGTDKQTCNGFQPYGMQLSWQCMGYAEKLGYDATGSNPRINASGWITDRDVSALKSLKPGDIVRYGNNSHSIYITDVSGETVTYTDCNSDGRCIIRWNATISKADLKKTFSYVRSAPFEIQQKEKASISKASITLSKNSYTYDKKEKKPTVISVTLNGKTLKSGTDYKVSYKNNKNIGKATVTITGKGNYSGTAKKNFTIKAKKGVAFSISGKKYKVTNPSSKTVAFTGISNTKTTKVTIPKTVTYGGATFKVTSIADKALKEKAKITQVTIGANIKTIGDSAFEGCKKLSKVTIGSAVTVIEDKAFKNCTALKSITIPNKVTKLDKQAFYGCKNLKAIRIKSTKLKTIAKEAFHGIHAKASITVPKSKLATYKKLFHQSGCLNQIR